MSDRLPLQHCKKHGRHYRTFCYECKDLDVVGKERRDLFKQVALAYVPYANEKGKELKAYLEEIERDTEAILKAAADFGKAAS